jgi:hypothetical protein
MVEASERLSFGAGFRIGDVFARTFDVFGRRIPQYFALTLIAHVPVIALTYAVSGVRADRATLIWIGVAAFLLTLICTTLAQAVIIYGVFQDMRGRASSIGESLQIGLRRFFPMVGLALCVGLLTALGGALLLIPGLMFACRYYVAMPACIVEQEGVFASMKRSATLTRGYRWQIFGIFFLLLLISFIGGFVLGFVIVAFGPIVQQIVSTIWQVLVGAFGAVVAAIVYYRLRVVQEGVDIDRIADVFD